jgi:hypothetical protein
MEKAMKKIIVAVALTAVFASPAFSQTTRRGDAPRALRSAPSVEFLPTIVPGGPAVVEGGQYIGADPDPQVRMDLSRQGANYNIGGNN